MCCLSLQVKYWWTAPSRGHCTTTCRDWWSCSDSEWHWCDPSWVHYLEFQHNSQAAQWQWNYQHHIIHLSFTVWKVFNKYLPIFLPQRYKLLSFWVNATKQKCSNVSSSIWARKNPVCVVKMSWFYHSVAPSKPKFDLTILIAILNTNKEQLSPEINSLSYLCTLQLVACCLSSN